MHTMYSYLAKNSRSRKWPTRLAQDLPDLKDVTVRVRVGDEVRKRSLRLCGSNWSCRNNDQSISKLFMHKYFESIVTLLDLPFYTPVRQSISLPSPFPPLIYQLPWFFCWQWNLFCYFVFSRKIKWPLKKTKRQTVNFLFIFFSVR